MIGRMLLSLVGLTLVAACTTNQMLRSEPAMVLESDQSPAALERCIGLAMSLVAPPSTIRGESDTIMNFGNAAVVSIFHAQPTRIEVRKGLALNTKFRRRIRECAATGDYKP